MAIRHSTRKKDTQRDREDRPQPALDAVEGDEQTIEESLRQKADKPKTNEAGKS